MDHLNGRARRLPEDFPVLLLLFSQMERCAVQQAIPCMRKSADWSVMALCGCCMRRGLAIAAHVRYANTVKNLEQPSKHGGHAQGSWPSFSCNSAHVNVSSDQR